MRLIIDPALFIKYPTLNIGVLAVRDISNEASSERSSKLLAGEEARIRSEFLKETFFEHPKIAAWRRVYADFGVKPRDAKSSIENLYRIILSGKDIRRVSSLVDIYNSVSLKHMLPLGGEDLLKIEGDIHLTIAGESEPAVLLLGDEAAAAPAPGEVIYRDSVSAICRRWNWREADRAKLTERTKDAVLIIEGIAPVSSSEVAAALEELTALVRESCGGKSSAAVLNGDYSVFDFNPSKSPDFP